MVILSKRKYEKWVSWDLVYEWEDVLSEGLNVPIVDISPLYRDRLLGRIPYLNAISSRFKPYLYFELRANVQGWFPRVSDNNKYAIPIIIDYFLTDEEIPLFEKIYSRNKVVLVTSKEAYDHLKAKGCKLNIYHWPLSLSDKYKLTPSETFIKKYDLILMGRQNRVLEEWVKRYADLHPDFVYGYRKRINDSLIYYLTDGTCIGEIPDRESYISLMKSTKCILYATPGADVSTSTGSKAALTDSNNILTNGFSQVTPRFLEGIACGCHIIARYPENSDTDYFELNKICPNCNSYEQFEALMDKARNEPVDIKQYSDYLKNHYTSARIDLLRNLLNDNNFTV